MPPKPRVTHSMVKAEMLKHNNNLTEAAKALDISKSLASYHLYETGPGYASPSQAIRDSMPWKDIQPGHRNAPPYKRARWHAEYIATGGKGMSEAKLRYLRQWYQRLVTENEVLVYDPAIKPHRGSKTGGWDYVPREERDGELLFRANEFTEVSDETKVDWRLPDREFWPQV
ncbi:hypothetical protein [Amycolatopsis lexingtonensis]|uniref:hypothetical protein n=1 Tax=Amycolatopsis lexingtonensis TaxID=218822 RepID=UPI003F7301D8